MRRDRKSSVGSFLASSIRRKLTAIIVGVSAAALILAGLLIVLTQMATLRKNMTHDLVLQARMIANNSLAAVSFDDAEDASAVLQTLSSESALAYANVIRADGSILTFYRRDGFTDEPQSLPDYGGHAFTGRWLLVREPIVLDGKMIGTAFLQSDLSEFALFSRQIVISVTASMLAVFLMAWAASVRLLKIISKPVERLTETVRAVAQNRDYSIRADHAGVDEIGVFARAFNEMLSEVESRDAQLRDRERKAQSYLDVARVMIVALSHEGRVTLMNQKGCQILGMKEADIVGKDWVECFVPEHQRESVRQLFKGLLSGESAAMEYYEKEILTGTGEERLIAWSNSAVKDETGRVISILSSGTDITEKRRSEKREAALNEQLARAERMKSIGVLAGGVAHDLNNILGPMVALPGLLEMDVQSALDGDQEARKEIKDSLEVLKTAASRASNVVRDLVALSRRGHYERIASDLNKMFCLASTSGALANLRETRPDVQIEQQNSEEPLTVLASEDHICRVVDNVLRNAVESVGRNGRVTIATSSRHLDEAYNGYTIVPAGDYAVIEVTDNGQGIAPQDLNRIFEPFYTRKAKTDRSGSGLGLSIVHGIMEDHEGFVDVVSELGSGTKFTLYLPLTSAPEGLSPESDSGPLARGSGHVLVVDDEPGQRFLASKSLRQLGYTADLAEDGRAALRLFAEAKKRKDSSPYDLIILDMVMEPDYDGLHALRDIRALYPEQKVIIASGHAEDDRSLSALELGAQWLAKPYSVKNLARAVQEMLSRDAKA